MTQNSGSHRAHSIIGASGFDRWSRCPGSVRLQRVAEAHGRSTSSAYAREGTAAHEIAADCIENDRDTWEWVAEQIEVEGETFVVDDEMAEAVQVWVGTIRQDAEEYRRDTGQWPTILVEVTFDLSEIREEAFGTSDIVMMMPAWKLLRVYDYKHGVGIPVNVVRNGQLMYYGVGAVHSLGRQGNPYEALELVVVQPRNTNSMGPVRRWRTDYEDLTAWMEDELLPAIDRTREHDAPLEPGDHCRFCPAKTFCPALHELAEEALHMEGEVKPLSDEDLGRWMERKKALQHFLKALDDEAYSRLSNGHKVPGIKLVPKKANRTWMEGAEKTLKAKLGSVVYKQELKSPAQIEKLDGGKELAKELAYKPEGGLTLASEDDNRPGVKPQKAADVFSDY